MSTGSPKFDIRSALVHEDLLILPRDTFAESGFRPGETLKTIIWDDGRLEINNRSHEDRFDGAHVVGAAAIALHPKVLSHFNLAPGDIVTFEVQERGRLDVRRLASADSDPTYLQPRRDAEGLPIPPGWLVQAFSGSPEADGCMASGKAIAEQFCEWIGTAGRDIARMQRILDFGCGCGRVLQAFHDRTSAELIGVDLHKPAIDWCNRHFPFLRASYGSEFPPILLDSDSVDFIYAISVLTHLDEAHQDAWLQEWRRILKPGGLAFISYRNEDYIDTFPEPTPDWAVRDVLVSQGLLFEPHRYWAGIFPAFYAGTFHSEDYVRRHWGEFFDILWTVGAGKSKVMQNVAVLRKRAG